MHGQQMLQRTGLQGTGKTVNKEYLKEIQLNIQYSLLNMRHTPLTACPACPALFAVLNHHAGAKCEELDKHYNQYAIRREFAHFEQDSFCVCVLCLVFGCISGPSGKNRMLLHAQ